jgi:class 3 adenylate cyclase
MAERVLVFKTHPIINSTTIFVGDMGLSQRFNYNSLGSGINLAAGLKSEFRPCHIGNVPRSFTALQPT